MNGDDGGGFCVLLAVFVLTAVVSVMMLVVFVLTAVVSVKAVPKVLRWLVVSALAVVFPERCRRQCWRLMRLPDCSVAVVF